MFISGSYWLSSSAGLDPLRVVCQFVAIWHPIWGSPPSLSVSPVLTHWSWGLLAGAWDGGWTVTLKAPLPSSCLLCFYSETAEGTSTKPGGGGVTGYPPASLPASLTLTQC